ncbi:DUF2516 family protein [Streptomyces sp. ODS28]|uniref:DUF2516 family protein n=1 Tax=Streptomyces sp. ODS28 TaxID=3136688 RepID=UPI0031E94E11
MLAANFMTGAWLVIYVVLLCLAAFALIDSAFRREDAYRAADKQTKPFWLTILGITTAVNVLAMYGILGGFAFILQLAGLVATIVYIVDVRPALRHVSGGRGPRRRGGSSSDGPYGPFNG